MLISGRLKLIHGAATQKVRSCPAACPVEMPAIFLDQLWSQWFSSKGGFEVLAHLRYQYPVFAGCAQISEDTTLGFPEHESCLKTGWFYRGPEDLTQTHTSLNLALKFFRKLHSKGLRGVKRRLADRWWVNSFLSFQFSRSFVLLSYWWQIQTHQFRVL